MSNLASTGWPSAGNVSALGWGTEPQNMMPKRLQGWPAGTQRAANDAERLLSTAVGWWDAAYYTAGDRFLRNRGVAGDLLNMRLGSALAANSNDPRYTAPEEVGYCYLPGVSGNYLSVPDAAPLDITGDIDIIARVSLTAWSSGALNTIASKWTSSAGARSWIFRVTATGSLEYVNSTDGTGNASYVSTAKPSVVDGQSLWVRVTFDVDTGATTNAARFYTAPDSSTVPTSWTQLGIDVSKAGTSSIYSGTSSVFVGCIGATADWLNGNAYRAIVKDGIDGTTVLDVNPDVLTDPSQTTFVEQSSNAATVTINRATAGRKTVAMPARGRGGRAIFLLGSDDFLECPTDTVWQNQLANFDRGDSFTAVGVVRQWATVATNTAIAKTDNNSATMRGWMIYQNSNTQTSMRVGDGTTRTVYDHASNGTTTSLSLFALQIDRPQRLLRSVGALNATTTLNTGPILPVAPTPQTSPTTNVITIGRYGSIYSDFEFTAAAVFRRLLTAAELTTLTTYFQNRNL